MLATSSWQVSRSHCWQLIMHAMHTSVNPMHGVWCAGMLHSAVVISKLPHARISVDASAAAKVWAQQDLWQLLEDVSAALCQHGMHWPVLCGCSLSHAPDAPYWDCGQQACAHHCL